jgi:hypothetical protein
MAFVESLTFMRKRSAICQFILHCFASVVAALHCLSVSRRKLAKPLNDKQTEQLKCTCLIEIPGTRI